MSGRGHLKWREAFLGPLIVLFFVSMASGNWIGVLILGPTLILLMAWLSWTYDREGRYGPKRDQRRR